MNNSIRLSTSETRRLDGQTLSALLVKRGITTWEDAITYIKHLPYGRNANRIDLSLVIKEGKGTCSSKHAVLKTLANENDIEGVKLILGMYKMTQENTPGIGNFITKSGLSFIPEAHCYLLLNGEPLDVTSPTSSMDRITNAVLSETEIAPNQVGEWKVDYHRNFIKSWRISEGIEISFEAIWTIRENCITALSGS